MIADFFSRPPPRPIQMIAPVIPCVYPFEPLENLPAEVKNIIFEKLLQTRSIECFKTYLEITIFHYGLVFRGLKFHHDFHFFSLFHIHELLDLPKEALYFLWYLCDNSHYNNAQIRSWYNYNLSKERRISSTKTGTISLT